MKPILVPYDENMTKEELLKAIADAVGSDVETIKKELCEPKTEPQYHADIECNYKDCDNCGHKEYCPQSKTEPQKETTKGLQLFADILFDKNKTAQFLEECKAMGIEP